MRRRRPGRARKYLRRRTASGRLARDTRVLPTPELLRHRQALVGQDGDQRLAESPLGVLLALGLISEEERMAGQRFAWLYRLTIGRLSLRAADPLIPREPLGAEVTPPLGAGQAAWLAAREADLEDARIRLTKRGTGIYEMVLRFAVAQSYADWMGVTRQRTSAEAQDLLLLQEGLGCLAETFGLLGKRSETPGDRKRAEG
ncbi:MAG: hypothetical protein RIC87_07195 [Kiloniellales bacterium]